MTLTALMLLALAPNAQAVQVQSAQTDDPVVVLPDIEVTTTRRGVALGGQEPIVSYDAAQIQAFGATSIGELVTLLEAQTRSARGGPPVFLVNGRRISGFREIRGLPPEAIDRFDVLPEETALSYGYSADQRVVNVVLKANFRSITASGTVTRPTSGGQTVLDNSNNVLRIAGSSRWSMDLNLNAQTALFETERRIDRTGGGELFDLQGNIGGLPYRDPADPTRLLRAQIDPALSALAGRPITETGVPDLASGAAPTLNDFLATAGTLRQGDLNAYRTLQPNTGSAEISGTLKKDLNRDIGATFSASLKDSSSLSYLGLPGVTLTLPSGNPYSPFGDDVQLFRYLDRPDTLRREVDSLTAGVGTVLDGFVGDWRWTLTGTYDWVETKTSTGRGVDAAALQASLTAGDPMVNPFGDIDVRVPDRLRDTAKSTSGVANAELVVNGKVWSGPAGDLTSTFKVGAQHQSLDSESLRNGVASDRSLSRDLGRLQANFRLPIASRDKEVLAGIGDLALNLNLAYDELSDFGGVSTIGGGLNWSPIQRLSLGVDYSDAGKAPSMQQLNDPTVSTPNTPVFDFRTGETIEVAYVTGGAPNLKAEDARSLKLSANWQPFSERDLRFNLAYTRTETDDQIAGFPTITPALEAALPERFQRDGDGTLLSIDARPLNFSRREQQDVQWGFNFSRAFGKPMPAAERGERGPGRLGIPGGGEGGPRMAGPGGPGGTRGPGGGGMQPGQGMFNLSLTHTWRLQDEVTIRDGLAPLDLLDGDAISGSGGQSRHEVQLQAGAFRNGLGMFVNANWRDGTHVKGADAASPSLDFSGRTTINLFAFADLTQRAKWVEKFPVLKGTRVGFGVTNIFDDRVSVRSSDGQTPLNYQPDFLDPTGRTFRINLRKILF
nr:TonB-dependent receptor [uncultured Brevundimonas sp.]